MNTQLPIQTLSNNITWSNNNIELSMDQSILPSTSSDMTTTEKLLSGNTAWSMDIHGNDTNNSVAAVTAVVMTMMTSFLADLESLMAHPLIPKVS